MAQNEEPTENLGESVMLPTSSPGITVEVCNPQVKDETFNKYVIYTLKGSDKNGEWNVTRRYSDFAKVRAMLVARWPGCYIPALPPKALNSLEAKVVRERRKYLTRFCQKIAELSYLHYFGPYQDFLRTNGNVEKMLTAASTVDYDEVINRYADTFSQLSGKEYNVNIIRKIVDFKNFLKKSQGQMENLKKVARRMTKSKNLFYQEFSSLNNLVSMQYEKAVMNELHGGDESKNVFYGPHGPSLYQFAEKVEEGSKRASLEYIEEWIKAESREIEAFIDAIDQKENYEALKGKSQNKQKSETDDLQKVLSGKSTMKGLFMRKTKDEEVADLERQISKHSKDYDNLSKLNDMIVLVLAYEEIDKFKGNKLIPYYNLVRIAATNELAALNNMEQYWSSLLQNENLVGLPDLTNTA